MPAGSESSAKSPVACRTSFHAALFAVVIPLASGTTLRAEHVDFNRDVLPILSANCFACHGPDENARKADLRLDIPAGADSESDGPLVIVPGKPAESELLKRLVAGKGRMPPPKAGPALAPTQVETLRKWVEQGAGYAEHWAFVPPRRPEVPADSKQPSNPIDAFVRHRREQFGLPHARPATRETLVRRATLDLTGLPPTPAEVDRFVADPSPDAYDRLLDRLLASPHYGERWGRHWLDVARYADSGGFETDIFFSHAWRYRDYVIRSLNADKPFDRFVKEQIAGDVLYPGDADARIATGLYTIGPVLQEAAMVPNKLDYEWLTDAADTTGSAFLGLTVGCARCHDHKYDPVSQRDYFALQAVFASSNQADLRPDGTTKPVVGKAIVKTTQPEYELEQTKARARRETNPAARARHLRQIAEYYTRTDVAKKGGDPKRVTGPAQEQEDRAEKYLIAGSEIPTRVLDRRDNPLEVKLLARGELEAPGDPVPPGLPAKLTGGRQFDKTPPDRWRAELADWVASPGNPLTARVIVNRVWQWHFGEGLVRTPSDFGIRGDRPTHPELLDYLADDFVKNGWSLKHLHRAIMTSDTYRMSAATDPATLARDADNQWLTRFQPRRFEAEVIWDALRAVSGTLDPTVYGLPFAPPLDGQEQVGNFRKWPTSTPDESNRRAVYLLARRSFRFPMLAAFDLPDGASSCAQRDVTTVPNQALALLNNRTMKEQAGAFAGRLLRETDGTPPAVADLAWRYVYGRAADDEERRKAVEFLRERARPGDPRRAVEELCLALFNTNEFLYLP